MQAYKIRINCTNPYPAVLMSHLEIGCPMHDRHSIAPATTQSNCCTEHKNHNNNNSNSNNNEET